MKLFTLSRRYFDHGTFGILQDELGNEICKTVERAWHNNKAGISCVPEGEYLLQPHNSPKYGDCYALVAPELGVSIYGPSQRTHILVHPANYPEQLQGCIAPGLDFGVVKGKWAVVDSKSAVQRFEQALNGESARLVIGS